MIIKLTYPVHLCCVFVKADTFKLKYNGNTIVRPKNQSRLDLKTRNYFPLIGFLQSHIYLLEFEGVNTSGKETL